MPMNDLGSHDPAFSAEQVAQCARIVDGLREIGTKVVRLSSSLEVQFLKRTPIEQPLRFETWVDEVEGDRYRARGFCMLGDTRISEAQGLIIGKYDLPVTGEEAP